MVCHESDETDFLEGILKIVLVALGLVVYTRVTHKYQVEREVLFSPDGRGLCKVFEYITQGSDSSRGSRRIIVRQGSDTGVYCTLRMN